MKLEVLLCVLSAWLYYIFPCCLAIWNQVVTAMGSTEWYIVKNQCLSWPVPSREAVTTWRTTNWQESMTERKIKFEVLELSSFMWADNRSTEWKNAAKLILTIFIYNAVLVFVFGVNKKVTETNIFHFIVHASTIVTTSCFQSLDGLLTHTWVLSKPVSLFCPLIMKLISSYLAQLSKKTINRADIWLHLKV